MAPAVEMKAVSKQFDGRDRRSTLALDRIDLEVQEGEFCAIVGPTGCGKSTSLTVISGLEEPTSGSVYAMGEPVRGVRPDIGFVFQQDALLPWRTVKENVCLGPRYRGVKRREAALLADRWIRTVGLLGFERHYPSQLSGGMRKRVSLAQCLVTNPRIILMDEPFAALDAQTKIMMGRELLRLWEDTGSTVLFVTHDLDEAIRLADRVVVMTARPARVKASFRVDIPRPRDVMDIRQTPGFDELYQEIWSCLKSEVELGFALSASEA